MNVNSVPIFRNWMGSKLIFEKFRFIFGKKWQKMEYSKKCKKPWLLDQQPQDFKRWYVCSAVKQSNPSALCSCTKNNDTHPYYFPFATPRPPWVTLCEERRTSTCRRESWEVKALLSSAYHHKVRRDGLQTSMNVSKVSTRVQKLEIMWIWHLL